MEFKIGNIFGNKKQEPKQQTAVEKNIGEQGGISAEQFKIEQQKEKVMKMIEKDAKLKRAYDFWFNKTDKTGKNMQDILVEFLMENRLYHRLSKY